MKIALVAEDATALSHATSSEPATQESRVAALATELTRQQHEVTVYARKDAGDLPDRADLPGGATVRYVPAGPAGT
jgi:D-inositol-3-phosphate glycosyltransferase